MYILLQEQEMYERRQKKGEYKYINFSDGFLSRMK